jgi:hypothetical protein
MKETSITDDDDSSFISTVEERKDEKKDPDKDIKSKLFYYLGGIGLFYVIELISSFVCKLCGKGNNNDIDAAGVDITNGADTHDSIHVSTSLNLGS